MKARKTFGLRTSNRITRARHDAETAARYDAALAQVREWCGEIGPITEAMEAHAREIAFRDPDLDALRRVEPATSF